MCFKRFEKERVKYPFYPIKTTHCPLVYPAYHPLEIKTQILAGLTPARLKRAFSRCVHMVRMGQWQVCRSIVFDALEPPAKVKMCLALYLHSPLAGLRVWK
jgi:hypothetical protein